MSSHAQPPGDVGKLRGGMTSGRRGRTLATNSPPVLDPGWLRPCSAQRRRGSPVPRWTHTSVWAVPPPEGAPCAGRPCGPSAALSPAVPLAAACRAVSSVRKVLAGRVCSVLSCCLRWQGVRDDGRWRWRERRPSLGKMPGWWSGSGARGRPQPSPGPANPLKPQPSVIGCPPALMVLSRAFSSPSGWRLRGARPWPPSGHPGGASACRAHPRRQSWGAVTGSW